MKLFSVVDGSGAHVNLSCVEQPVRAVSQVMAETLVAKAYGSPYEPVRAVLADLGVHVVPHVQPEQHAAKSKQAKQTSMAAVDFNAGEWRDVAFGVVEDVCRTNNEFTADDIWATGLEPPPNDARALGPVMLRASRAGLCEKTGRSTPTKRVGHHACEIAIWRSMIHAR